MSKIQKKKSYFTRFRNYDFFLTTVEGFKNKKTANKFSIGFAVYKIIYGENL